MKRKKLNLDRKKDFKQFKFNIDNVSKIINNKKYQLMGTYPDNDELVKDLKRLHKKWGFELRTEKASKNTVKVWSRKVKTIRNIKMNHNFKYP